MHIKTKLLALMPLFWRLVVLLYKIQAIKHMDSSCFGTIMDSLSAVIMSLFGHGIGVVWLNV